MFNFLKIQALHKATQNKISLPLDWPENWKAPEFKEYLRFPRTYLPESALNKDFSFIEILGARSSARKFEPDSELSLEALSRLLKFSSGLRDKNRRFYPSAGARYPLEVYAALQNTSKLENGLFHYNVKEHALEKISGKDEAKKIRESLPEKWAQDAQIIVIISAKFDRMLSKYQGRGYRFALMEAGALMQNFYLVSAALKLGSTALGAGLDEILEEILDLDSDQENVLGILAIGASKNERN